jgi:4-amino-4-deoxy-L-arabinose transferase-like glycosyltransferase
MTPTVLSHASTWPRSLFAYLPLIWSRVLFPGAGTSDGRVRRLSLAVLIVLPALVLYPSSSIHLLEPDESRYAQIPREMLARGDWVVPHLQSEPYLDKPPLMYWLVMLSYSVFGVSVAAARLIPALAIHGTILASYGFGRKLIGERGAFWGSLLLSVAPGLMSVGRLLILDGLLALCTTVAMFAAFLAMRGDRLHRGWWLLAAVAAGAGVLTKGPVILVLTAIPIAMYRLFQGPTCRIGWKAIAVFLAVVFMVNLPWYVAIGLRKPEFLTYFFWKHNVMRFVAPFDHIKPIWFYLPILAVGLAPGALLLLWFVRFALSSKPANSSQRSPEFGFLLLAGGWIVAFFSLSGSKLPTYILPAFPFLALALGHFVAVRWPLRPRLPAVMIGLTFSALMFLHHIGLPRYARMRSPMAEPEKVAKYCADPNQAVICFPRSCDSVAFYLGRSDLRNVRSKQSQDLIEDCLQRDRTTVLFTHRHSLGAMKLVMPPDLVVTEVVSFRRDRDAGYFFDWLAGETPWGLCDLAVVERRNKKQ